MATRTIRFQLNPEYFEESIELLSTLYDGAELSIAVDNGDFHPIYTANTDVQKEQILVYEDSSTVLLKIKVIDKKRSDWELGNQIEFYTPIDLTDLDLALFRMTRGQGGELQCLLNDVVIFALINEKTDLRSIPNDILALFAYRVNDISKLPQMPITNVAWFQDCAELISLRGLSNLPSLHKLSLWKCKSIQNADILKNLTQLTQLSLFSCHFLQNIDDLGNLTQLTELNLSYCYSIQNVDSLEKLTQLTDLNLSNCKSLQNVDGLRNVTRLTTLDLSYCDSLQNVDGLRNVTQLTMLDLFYCNYIQNVDSLENLTQLTELDLSYCYNIQNVDSLEKLTQLTDLNLSHCKSLQNVDGLENLIQLTKLDLYYCSSLQNVDGLRNLTQLTKLNLRICESLSDVAGLGNLTQLTKLEISYCPYLLDFSPLQGCVSLKSMSADKPNIVIEILIHTAVLRKDTDYIFENFSDWLKECQSSPLRDSMLQDVVKALAICGNGSWVLKGLETIMRSMRTSGLNEKLLCDTLQVISDLEFSEEVKLIAEICLEPGKADQADAAEIRIRAHLSTFTSFPESSREWALSLALELTNIARTDEHLLNATAADIILFYARMDQEELLDEWLGLITPTAADTAYVALSRYYLGENNIEQALSCAANIQGSIVRDPISQQLAEYFVTLDPELSAEQFQIISDTALKTETAKHLMQHAEFTASPANFCALLMTLQTDRQALGEMLNTVIAHHPRASVFTDLFPPEVPANDVDSLTGLFNELGKGGFVDEGSEILQSLDGGDRQAILSGVLVTLAKRGKIS